MEALKIYNAEISMGTTPLPLEMDVSFLDCFQNQSNPNNGLYMALNKLTVKEIFILERIYADQYTEKEVGKMLGISQKSVHCHKKHAIKKLKMALISHSGIAIKGDIHIKADGGVNL